MVKSALMGLTPNAPVEQFQSCKQVHSGFRKITFNCKHPQKIFCALEMSARKRYSPKRGIFMTLCCCIVKLYKMCQMTGNWSSAYKYVLTSTSYFHSLTETFFFYFSQVFSLLFPFNTLLPKAISLTDEIMLWASRQSSILINDCTAHWPYILKKASVGKKDVTFTLVSADLEVDRC